MENRPEKTGITELSALATVGFSIYQGYKTGVINPALIGQMVEQVYSVLSIVIPAVIFSCRMAYKKWFRRSKPINRRRSEAGNDNT